MFPTPLRQPKAYAIAHLVHVCDVSSMHPRAEFLHCAGCVLHALVLVKGTQAYIIWLQFKFSLAHVTRANTCTHVEITSMHN